MVGSFLNTTVDTTVDDDKSGILNRLSLKFSSENLYRVNGRISFDRKKRVANQSPAAELHLSAEPELEAGKITDVKKYSDLKTHPIGGTLIELINNVPRGSYIRVAVYIFSNKPVKDALIRAYERGVVVRVLTTKKGEKTQIELSEIMRGQNTESYAALCANKRVEKNPGGCISDHLSHHKFVTLSTICRFGLDEKGDCHNKDLNDLSYNSYKNVVFQASWNFGNVKKHEMASVFFGNEELYDVYIKHFARLRRAMEDSSPNLDFYFKKNVQMDQDSFLEVNFTPRKRDPKKPWKESDLFLQSFSNLDCGSKKDRTIIRVANTHWGSSIQSPVADNIIKEIGIWVKKGCIVRILLPADMAATVSKVPNEIHVSLSDAKIYNELIRVGADVRSFAYAPNISITNQKNAAHMHAKYALIETVGNIKNSKLMFGTMSFTTTAQERNDEAWLVWSNPSRVSFEFYRSTFDKMWSALPSNRLQ